MADLDIEWPDELQEEWISEPEPEPESPTSNSGFSETGSVCDNTVEIKPLESNQIDDSYSTNPHSEIDTGSVVVRHPPKTPDWKNHLKERLLGPQNDLLSPQQTPGHLERIFTPPTVREASAPVPAAKEAKAENIPLSKSQSSKNRAPAARLGNKATNFEPSRSKLSTLHENNDSPGQHSEFNDESIINPIATSTLRKDIRAPAFGIPREFLRANGQTQEDSSSPDKKYTPGTVRSNTSSQAEGFSEIALTQQKGVDGRTVYTPVPIRAVSFVSDIPESSPMADNKVYPSSPPWVQKQAPTNRPLSSRLAEHNGNHQEAASNPGLDANEDSVMHRFLNSSPNLPRPLSFREECNVQTPEPSKGAATPTLAANGNLIDNAPPLFSSFQDRRTTPPRTPLRTPRTPSPSKKAPGTPRSKPGSPLKLFCDQQDTFTKAMLQRRMSQLSMQPSFEAEQGKSYDENAVADEEDDETREKIGGSKSGRSQSEVIRNIPSLLPKSKAPQNLKASTRRPRSQTTGSATSTVNDGIRAPKSPMKDRTPKRIRRSLSGSYKPNGQGEVLPSRERARVRREECIPEVETPPAEKSTIILQQTPRRNESPSPTPRRRRDLPTIAASPSTSQLLSPEERKKATPISRRTAQPLRTDSDDRVEFKGYGGVGPLADTSFEPNVSTSDTSGPARKGSVTTQDFLAQAEEVMARIRGLKQRSLRAETEQKRIRKSIAQLNQPTEKPKRKPTPEEAEDSDNSYGLPDFDESTQLDENLLAEMGNGATTSNSRPRTRQEERSKMSSFDSNEGNAFPQNRRDDEAKWDQGNYSSVMLVPQSEQDEESDQQESEYDAAPEGVSPPRELPSRSAGITSRTRSRQRHQKANIDVDLDGNPNIVAFGTFQGKNRRESSKVQPQLLRSASDGVKNIRPTEVEHMISNISGSMEFDEQRMKWVKRKSQDTTYTPSDDIEDPFAEVSDLVVDEEQEAQFIERIRKEMIDDVEEFVMNSADEEEGDESLRKLQRQNEERLEAHDQPGEEGHGDEDTNNQSLISLRERSEGGSTTSSPPRPQHMADSSRVLPSSQPRPLPRRPHVQFSSPVTRDFAYSHTRISSQWSSSQAGDQDILIDQSYVNPIRNRRMPSQVFSSAMRSSTRRSKLGRSVSRLMPGDPEGSDTNRRLSFTNSFRRLSMSSAMTPLPTPLSQRTDLQVAGSSPSRHPDVSFHNSTVTHLPDISYRFEATEALLNLELSHIAENRGLDLTHMKAVHELFSQAQEILVKHITDIEPFEPYWDGMRFLRLARKGVTTLSGLQEWCPRIEELDVSENEIGQVSGVPNTVRTLKIPNNLLSTLTAWGHLTNIQYLDISKNRIDDLTGLRHMVHLRELRADDNYIDSLDGIAHLDGLLSLRLRRNKIKHLTIESSLMTRLSELDLRGNEMESISGLEHLVGLTSLNLEQNELSSLGLREGVVMDSIRNLKLTYNNFSTFDVKTFPNLKLLLLDNNQLCELRGLKQAKHIDTLSLKNQTLAEGSSLPEMADMYEVRKLFLSRNPYRTLTVPLDFMNLQYLELANTQLSSLPKEFGHVMSNTRVLNLNYNVLQDIRPLYGMCRLKKLLLVGNRISSMKRTAAVFRYFPHLSTLDLRLNPLTLGFYPPQSTTPHSLPVEPDSYPAEPFLLQDAGEGMDVEYRARLDVETAVLRRRYEVWCVKELKRLKKLDGLSMAGKDWKSDSVWKEMVRRGLVIEEAVTPVDGQEAGPPWQIQELEAGTPATEAPPSSSKLEVPEKSADRPGPSRTVSNTSHATGGSSIRSSPSIPQKETILASE